jgi:hypothetical protein
MNAEQLSLSLNVRVLFNPESQSYNRRLGVNPAESVTGRLQTCDDTRWAPERHPDVTQEGTMQRLVPLKSQRNNGHRCRWPFEHLSVMELSGVNLLLLFWQVICRNQLRF